MTHGHVTVDFLLENSEGHSAVAELHLVGLAARGQGQQLMPQADAEDGGLGPLLHHLAVVVKNSW